MAERIPAPREADFAGWHRTVWEGTRQPPFYVSHFRHHVRVRQRSNGRIEAEWYNDDRRHGGRGTWQRFIQPHMAERMYRQALVESAPPRIAAEHVHA